MDIQHVAGKSNLVADCLSRAITEAVHLGLDYALMAAEQATDPDMQAFRTVVTGLQLEDVAFNGAGTTILCDIPRPATPVVLAGWRWQVLKQSTASLTQAGNPHCIALQQKLSLVQHFCRMATAFFCRAIFGCTNAV